MVSTGRLVSVAALAVAAACGGGSSKATGPTTPGTGNRTMSARIDGATWTATNVAASGANGTLIVSGARGTDAAVSITASLIQGTGTQAMGRNSIALGAVTIGNTQWAAGNLLGSGSVTLTLVTATRAVGTFAFTAPAVSASTFPATKTVTSGAFDVTF
jgi:hypothetical protein